MDGKLSMKSIKEWRKSVQNWRDFLSEIINMSINNSIFDPKAQDDKYKWQQKKVVDKEQKLKSFVPNYKRSDCHQQQTKKNY